MGQASGGARRAWGKQEGGRGWCKRVSGDGAWRGFLIWRAHGDLLDLGVHEDGAVIEGAVLDEEPNLLRGEGEGRG